MNCSASSGARPAPGVGGGTGAVHAAGLPGRCPSPAHASASRRRARSGWLARFGQPCPSPPRPAGRQPAPRPRACRCRSRATKGRAHARGRGAHRGGKRGGSWHAAAAGSGRPSRRRRCGPAAAGGARCRRSSAVEPGRPHRRARPPGRRSPRARRPPLPSRATLARPSVSRTRIGVSPLRRIASASARAASSPAASGVPPPPGKPGEAALGAHQRAGRRQQQFGAACRERPAAPRGRGGRSSRPAAARRRPSPRPAGCSAAEPEASTTKIVVVRVRCLKRVTRKSSRRTWTRGGARSPRSRRRKGCQGAAARRVSTRFSRAPGPRLARAGRRSAGPLRRRSARGPGLAGGGARPAPTLGELQLRQEIRRAWPPAPPPAPDRPAAARLRRRLLGVVVAVRRAGSLSGDRAAARAPPSARACGSAGRARRQHQPAGQRRIRLADLASARPGRPPRGPTRSASSGARTEPMPSAIAARAQRLERSPWRPATAGRQAPGRGHCRRRRALGRRHPRTLTRPRSRWNARRSSRAAGGRSSSAEPSSSATTPSRAGVPLASPSRSSSTSPASSTAARRAAVPRRQPLRHGQQQHAAVGLGQEAALGDRPARAQGGGEIEPAQQATVGDCERQPAQRRCRRQRARAAAPARRRAPARQGAQRDAAHSRRIDREQRPPPARASAHRPPRPAARRSRPEQLRDGTLDAHGRAGIVERVAAQAVAQRGRRHPAQVRVADRRRRPRGSPARGRRGSASARRAGRPCRAPMHSCGRPLERGVRHLDGRRAGRARPRCWRRSRPPPCVPLRDERRRIALERVAPSDHLDPGRQVVGRLHLDREAEPVEELRPQLALLRDCRCRPARSGPDGGCSGPRARPRSRPTPRRRAAGRRDGPPAGWPRRCRGSRGWRGPAARARTPSRRWVSARSRSSAPTTRSSVAPSGRSTTGTGACCAWPRATARRAGHSAHTVGIGADRSCSGTPPTTCIGGSRAASARTAVDLPVPRSPNTSTPPTRVIDRGDQQGQLHLVLADDRREGKRAAHAHDMEHRARAGRAVIRRPVRGMSRRRACRLSSGPSAPRSTSGTTR